jgi:hypothetical protein
LVAAFVAVLFPGNAAAAASNIYLAQNSVGAASGADCSDALSYTFFNNSGNWGGASNQIGPGTTVHLCGTITGAAGSTGLTFQGSGSNGSPITLKFEPGAVLQASEWGPNSDGSLAGAIVISGRSFIVIDGGATGNAGAGTFVPNGIIRNTLNGTIGGACPGGACTTNYNSNGITFQNVNNLTIENISIRDIYVRTSLSDEGGTGKCIQKIGGGSNNVTVNNVVLNNANAGFWYNLVSGSDSNLVISNDEFTNLSAGAALAQGNQNTGVLTGFSYFGNHLHYFNTWNETSGYAYHHDGLHIYTYSTPLTNLNIYNNKFDGDMGSGTAWLYYEQYAPGTGSINIFNNIFNSYATQSGNGAGGSRAIEFEGGSITGRVYNNTIIGVVHSGSIFSGPYNNGSPAPDMDLRNNTISGQLESLLEGSGVNSSTNNNAYDFSGGNFINILGGPSSLAAWRLLCGCDSASVSGSPDLNSNFIPNSGSILIGAGQNLTDLGITALNSDYAGNRRPSSGNWDIGAYASGTTAAQPNPPTSLAATVN